MLNEEDLKMVEAVVEELREILDPLRHGRPDNPQDQEEFNVVQKALKELGPEELEDLITLEHDYWTLFLGGSKESKFRKLHEKLKATHRTRALGWSACLMKLAVIKHRKYKDRFGRLHDILERLLAEIIKSGEVDPKLWDLAQLERSLTRRFLLCPELLGKALTEQISNHARCFFGILTALLFYKGAYLTPEERLRERGL